MNLYFDVDENNEQEDFLKIPEPAPHADIRPNPSPMQFIEDTILELTPLTNEDTCNTPNASPAQRSSNIVKTVDFHSLPVDASPAEAEEYDELDTSESGSRDAKCIALMGASGGTGVTTLCIQLAYDIAKRTRKSTGFTQNIDPTVCIIDLDFETGSCAAYLDLNPALEISDICGPAHRIDTSIVQALMSHHESGIAVLSTPSALGANSLANPEAVLALLDAASQLYDYVILDLPRIWQPWIGAAISGADHFAIVGELTIPSLHTIRDRIQKIETVLGKDNPCEVILNKVERRSFRNSIRLADAEKALQRDIKATICVDLDTTREAINCGQAVETIRPEARYVKDVRGLSLEWVPHQKKTNGLFRDRRKKRQSA